MRLLISTQWDKICSICHPELVSGSPVRGKMLIQVQHDRLREFSGEGVYM